MTGALWTFERPPKVNDPKNLELSPKKVLAHPLSLHCSELCDQPLFDARLHVHAFTGVHPRLHRHSGHTRLLAGSRLRGVGRLRRTPCAILASWRSRPGSQNDQRSRSGWPNLVPAALRRSHQISEFHGGMDPRKNRRNGHSKTYMKNWYRISWRISILIAVVAGVASLGSI